MSTSSVVIESKHISKHNRSKDPDVIIRQRKPFKGQKYDAIKKRIYRHFKETVTSSIVVFACLALYKISGVHDWWIHDVLEILLNP